MTCVGHRKKAPSIQKYRTQFPEIISPAFPRARRHALIPPNCSLSAAEADDLIQTRIQQPLFPPPDPKLLENIKPLSPPPRAASPSISPATTPVEPTPRSRESSSTSNSNDAAADTIPPIPQALARDPKRRAAWLKARAQYALDKYTHEHYNPSAAFHSAHNSSPSQSPKPTATAISSPGPKRKHSAFVQEQELKCQIEDRVGTPHISELQPDDDVSAQLNVEELGIVGAAAAVENNTVRYGQGKGMKVGNGRD